MIAFVKNIKTIKVNSYVNKLTISASDEHHRLRADKFNRPSIRHLENICIWSYFNV